MKKFILTAFVLALSYGVNSQNWWGKNKVRGNGDITTKTRDVGDFDGVSVGGFFDVFLVEGKEGTITIEGESNLLEYIETEVRSGDLRIRVEKGVNIKTTRKLKVTVPFEDIDKISLGGSGDVTSEDTIKANNLKVSLSGSGNINLNKIDANSLKTAISGSGDIELAGKVKTVKGAISGSGNIKGYNLKTHNLTASIAGSGNIRMTVKEEINASIAGSGNVYYKGNPPKIHTKSAGSGSVRERN